MNKEATWVAISGALVTLLSAMGLITASEGTALTTSTASAVSGIIGVVTVVTAIIKRRKGEGDKDGKGEDSADKGGEA